ncbi:MAG: redox-sensing transcriptional repressor Rex [Clostridia bacterium]|nr:redox-sensing transcriptional repressor Rex [Clostridia bacterium]
MNKDIPEISLQRLPVYLNYLRSLTDEDGKYISSGAIASALKLGEVLVRKDLAYTSSAGRPKVGYVRTELIAALEEYLGCNDVKNAILVGAGGLGRALLSYGGFGKYGIEVVEAYDSDPAKVGTNVGGKLVLGIDNMAEGIKKYNARLAIVAVPASAAQGVCELLFKEGINGILNFAPVLISAPDNVVVRNIDVAANLAILASMV